MRQRVSDRPEHIQSLIRKQKRRLARRDFKRVAAIGSEPAISRESMVGEIKSLQKILRARRTHGG